MAVASQTQSGGQYDRLQAATEARAQARVFRERAGFARRAARSPQGQKEKKTVRLMAYGGMLMVAGFKDFLDLVLFGSIPGLGTAVTSICFFIIFALLVLSSNVTVRPKTVFLMMAGGMLLSGGLTEGLLFGLNFLPISMGIVFGIYMREKAYALSMAGTLGAKQ